MIICANLPSLFNGVKLGIICVPSPDFWALQFPSLSLSCHPQVSVVIFGLLLQKFRIIRQGGWKINPINFVKFVCVKFNHCWDWWRELICNAYRSKHIVPLLRAKTQNGNCRKLKKKKLISELALIFFSRYTTNSQTISRRGAAGIHFLQQGTGRATPPPSWWMLQRYFQTHICEKIIIFLHGCHSPFSLHQSSVEIPHALSESFVLLPQSTEHHNEEKHDKDVYCRTHWHSGFTLEIYRMDTWMKCWNMLIGFSFLFRWNKQDLKQNTTKNVCLNFQIEHSFCTKKGWIRLHSHDTYRCCNLINRKVAVWSKEI